MVTLSLKKTQAMLVMGLLAAVFGLTACEKNPARALLEAAGETLFSNRPTHTDHFFAVIKLRTPPLLATARLDQGKKVINEDQKTALLDEQKKFLENLKVNAPDTQVIYQYQLVLNGFALAGPIKDYDKLKSLVQIVTFEEDGGFKPPTLTEVKALEQQFQENFRERNSVKFIGAENLRNRLVPGRGGQVHLDGTGMKVGIIDTGIDYTHSMLGGPGSPDVYKAIDPAKPSEFFPNKKVVGGVDLVGTKFDSASLEFDRHIPKPDANPLDEAGHGSHVAGTVAGLGDGVLTYDGVAPGADLYAIKVFGAEGSTSDSVVIKGLEFAADPNADGQLDDHLDVVNLSLGSAFGGGKILYSEAIQNLSAGGTVVVASAGNEGNIDYITGAPAVSDAAISVAASIDDTDHNWKIPAVQFLTPTQGAILSEVAEGPITKPIDEVGDATGPIVFVGLADADFTDELKSQVKGKVAFIDRGKVAFTEKIRRAQEAGAIGVVVANNQSGPAFAMGGEGKFEIPGVMITQEMGANLKAELKKGDVVIHFKVADKILKPELIDTITDFSSKGPRSEDSLIKPEITAPGSNIISAEMGKGSKGVKMSGTSMAGPHIAGAMTLLKQAHPDLSVAELKALLLNRAKTITDAKKVVYPVSRQGAGRVQIDQSVDAKVMLQPATLSLGEVPLESRKLEKKTVTLRNMTQAALNVGVKLITRGEGLRLKNAPALTLAAGEQKVVTLSLLLDATGMTELVREMDGWIVVTQDDVEVSRIPVLAVARKVTQIQPTKLVVESGSVDAIGAAATLTLTNSGRNSGDVLLFNLLGLDSRKKDPYLDPFMSRSCDLQSVGYRVIERDSNGEKIKVLQVAAKMYAPLTHWSACEVSVLIDSNGDEVAEQELAAVTLDNVPGLVPPGAKSEDKYSLANTLFDAAALRDLRLKSEKKAVETGKKVEQDYSSAVIDKIPFKPFDHATFVILEANVTKLARRATGELAIKVASQELSESSVEGDDYLNDAATKWMSISVDPRDQSFTGLPEKVTVAAGETKTVDLEKGAGTQPLMVLIPQNLTVFSDVLEDQQQFLVNPNFVEPQP